MTELFLILIGIWGGMMLSSICRALWNENDSKSPKTRCSNCDVLESMLGIDSDAD